MCVIISDIFGCRINCLIDILLQMFNQMGVFFLKFVFWLEYSVSVDGQCDRGKLIFAQ